MGQFEEEYPVRELDLKIAIREERISILSGNTIKMKLDYMESYLGYNRISAVLFTIMEIIEEVVKLKCSNKIADILEKFAINIRNNAKKRE